MLEFDCLPDGLFFFYLIMRFCACMNFNLQVCFQVMIDENIKEHNSSNIHGEIEIEKITSCTIETRSKDLIPVFDYLQTPMFQQPRSGLILITLPKSSMLQFEMLEYLLLCPYK